MSSVYRVWIHKKKACSHYRDMCPAAAVRHCQSNIFILYSLVYSTHLVCTFGMKDWPCPQHLHVDSGYASGSEQWTSCFTSVTWNWILGQNRFGQPSGEPSTPFGFDLCYQCGQLSPQSHIRVASSLGSTSVDAICFCYNRLVISAFCSARP